MVIPATSLVDHIDHTRFQTQLQRGLHVYIERYLILAPTVFRSVNKCEPGSRESHKTVALAKVCAWKETRVLPYNRAP